MTDTITKPMQGLAAYLRHASRDVHVGSKSRKTLMEWASEVEAALAAPLSPENVAKAFRETFLQALAAPQPEPQPVKQADKTYTWNDCLQSIIDQGGGPSTPVPQPVKQEGAKP